MLKCHCMILKLYSCVGNTPTLVVENNGLHSLKSTSHANMCTENDSQTDTIACVINFFLIGSVNEILKLHKSATCTNLNLSL